MKITRRGVVAVGIVLTAALALAGCTGGTSGTPTTGTAAFNDAVSKIVNPSTAQGGTVKLLAADDCDSWDPQRTYYGWCWNMQRIFTRSLIGYETVNGTKPVLAPDLATDMGTHNADFTKWTYTLQKDLKWSDGTAITPMDVKYGIERLFATDVINGGPASYFIATISHPADYLGPYTSGDLSSIETTADSITFNLSTPYSDFNYLMAMAAAAPVPYKVEGGADFTGANYTKRPLSSGPFKIESYTPTQEITFVRNKFWKQSTDKIRKPVADKITLTINSDVNDIDSKLKAGTADAKADNSIGTTLQSQVLTQPNLKKNADNPTTAFTRYFSVMPSVIPNQYCRQAIFYATNKAELVQAFGGTTAGTAAGSMTPPTIAGYSATANMYSTGADNTGDLTKAKEALKKCGQPDGFTTKLAYSTPSETGPKVFAAMQTALARVGIKITAATSATSSYYSSFIGSPANIESQGLGIAVAAWGADFPTGYGFWNSIANGATIIPAGNTDYPSLNDPAVNKILDAAPAGKSKDSDFRALDDQVMKNAVYLPILFGKSLYYRNARLTNVTSNNALAFGIYDFVNVGTGGK
ncbi:MAG: ABC transporter substrate-binding protein [Candidatus Saccharibacteria bacterium]|nr:ABC transporter substrate-binding protein [Microbacteriaceae bacterium]